MVDFVPNDFEIEVTQAIEAVADAIESMRYSAALCGLAATVCTLVETLEQMAPDDSDYVKAMANSVSGSCEVLVRFINDMELEK